MFISIIFLLVFLKFNQNDVQLPNWFFWLTFQISFTYGKRKSKDFYESKLKFDNFSSIFYDSCKYGRMRSSHFSFFYKIAQPAAEVSFLE